MIIGNDEYVITPKQLRWLAVILICILLVWTVTAIIGAYRPFEATYSCMEWYLEGDETDTVSVTFSGSKNMRGEFEGDITVYKGNEAVYSWTDCKIYRYNSYEFYICPADANVTVSFGKPEQVDMATDCYAIMFSDTQWSSFTIHSFRRDEKDISWFDGELPLMTTAQTLEEAREMTIEWTKDCSFELNYYNLHKDEDFQ